MFSVKLLSRTESDALSRPHSQVILELVLIHEICLFHQGSMITPVVSKSPSAPRGAQRRGRPTGRPLPGRHGALRAILAGIKGSRGNHFRGFNWQYTSVGPPLLGRAGARLVARERVFHPAALGLPAGAGGQGR